MDTVKLTRRGFLASTAVAVGLSSRAAAAISYTIEEIYSILDGEVKGPTSYTYDMVEWGGSGVLEFSDSEYLEFGDENYPTTTTPTTTTEPGDTSDTGGTSLPMHIDVKSMEPGTSILIMGVMAVLLAAVAILKNYAAGIMWALAFVLLIVSGLFGMSLQLYWLAIIFTGVLLAIGLAVRWGS